MVVACVAEDTPEWVERVRMLAFSIRHFGSGMSAVPLRAHFVGSADAAKTGGLDGLDVEVSVVSQFDPRCAWANKLRMLEAIEQTSCDLLLALDCDIVVMGDLRTRLRAEAVNAMVEWDDFLEDEEWDWLFSRFELAPGKKLEDPLRRRSTWPYLNSGVLAVPASMSEVLLSSWSDALATLYPLLERRPVLADRRNYLDQIALALALQAAQLPVEALPPAMNCHTGGFPDGLVPALEAPFVLHYHGHLDRRGYLRGSGNQVVDREIDRFNHAWSEFAHRPYEGLSRRPLTLWMVKRSPATRRLVAAAAHSKQYVSELGRRRGRT